MKRLHYLALTALFIVALVTSLSVGRYPIGPVEVGRILLAAFGLSDGSSLPPAEMQQVFWHIRLPRIILSFAIGCGISIAGVVYQGLFRNPLAFPDILGVKFGASFGAALVITFFSEAAITIQSSAFFFALLAVFSAYLIALKSWDQSPAVLVVAGIVISAIFQAGLNIVFYLTDSRDKLAQIIFWIMGTFQASSWDKVWTTLPVVVTGSLVLYLFSWRLNILTLDDEEALSLGINIRKWRVFYILLSTLVEAAAVAAVGAIQWVSLLVPHIARYLVGTEHSRLIPVAGFIGGIFLLFMDTLARSFLTSEIPISIVTSVFGAPFLAYLIINRKGGALGSDRASA
ncbi:MAG TPA: iron ABC transporter permease [Methylomusa anaerophila]|uniref:Putative ABC transporter permease protein n=1 Tax=Methylomusa anaerophila TaxID=1930071 RepID=A0A348AFQ7_9FIRM|nr:iron ABC transporter permease [Methylomusa anaerophila]BBB89905.1 putative ABC transporter permease protein [Methylomusa anaerophila]HML90565.1 iron ABC transporter permease [Methylomusa anaerophila]